MTRFTRLKELQELLDPIKIPVTENGGLGLCAVGRMFDSVPLIAVDHESKLPTQDEVKLIKEALDETLNKWYGESCIKRIMSKPYAMDKGVNTVLLQKFGHDKWKYRRITWTVGPYMMPPEGDTLENVLTRC